MKGIIVEELYDKKEKNIGVEMVSQVGFYNKFKHAFDYFEPLDIPSKEDLLKNGYVLDDNQIRVIDSEDYNLEQIAGILAENNILTKPVNEGIKTTFKDQAIQVETEIIIDRIIYRGICKIAFNYLAYVTDREFVLKSEFDGIRRFILYDEGDSDKYIDLNVNPILYNDQRFRKFKKKSTHGHLITLEWNHDINRIFCKLSLFNSTTYRINICRFSRAVWRPLVSGHHFNIKEKKVEKLLTLSKKLSPIVIR